jgi:hypothetical protein
MFSRLRKFLLVLPILLAAVALGACGDSHSHVSTGTYAGESGANAPYLNVGPLIYEVQLSRQLNPYNSEDIGYLEGLNPADSKLGPGEEWFAVFMQVYNNTEQALPASNSFTITDTQGNTYTPLEHDESNRYAYRGGTVPAKSKLPPADTTAYFGPTTGQLLLYKIKIVSLDNRPLELKIADPLNPSITASAELDV